MIITLIHCFSDYNKGDLGIILSTIKLLRKIEPGCTIHAVSTFEEHDPKFGTDHNVLKTAVDYLHPAVIGRLYSRRETRLGQLFKLFADIPKMIALMHSWFWPFRCFFLTPANRLVCDVLATSDLVISKGGSFLCSEPGIIGTVRYLRILCTLFMAQRLNSKVVILGQSLGPVYGRLNQLVLNKSLSHVYLIVLREDNCTNAYPYIQCPGGNTILGQDLAFSLDVPPADVSHLIPSDCDYVGITVKRFGDKLSDQEYSQVISKTIDYLVRQKKYYVVIIPQVTIDEDIDKALEIYHLLDDCVKEKVLLLKGDYSIAETLGLYSQISFLLGTRLHSTIFAMSMGTPAINIAYHGTKAQGVYQRLGLPQRVLVGKDFCIERIMALIDEHLDNKNDDFTDLKKRIEQSRQDNQRIVQELIQRVKNKQ